MTWEYLKYISITSTPAIIQSGSVIKDYTWGSWGQWTTCKSPSCTKTKVKYDAKTKNVYGKASGVVTPSANVTIGGTTIAHHANRTIVIDGVTRDTISAQVQYKRRGYTAYERTKALKKLSPSKMLKKSYGTYQYALRYRDKPITEEVPLTYGATGGATAYFAKYYKNKSNQDTLSPSLLPHPTKYELTLSDVAKNLESNTNNSDGRDNKGTYILTHVRQNVTSLDLEWEGLTTVEGRAIMGILSPTDGKKYLEVQYVSPVKGAVLTGRFYASDRKAVMYPNGMYKSISVTLKEV